MAGMPCPRGNFSPTSSSTRRDSEPSGRKFSWSFVVTSESGGAVATTAAPTTAQTAMTTAARRQLVAKLERRLNI